MLVIRQEQIDEFNDVNDIEFVERLRNILRDQYEEETEVYDDESLEELIHEGVERARSLYAMRWETALADFCGLMVELGDYFDEEPTINRHLTDEKIPPDRRIEFMVARIPENDWDEIRRNIYEMEEDESEFDDAGELE